eukprot:UN05341
MEAASEWKQYAHQQEEKYLKRIKDHEIYTDIENIKQTLEKHEKTLDLLQKSAVHSSEKVDKLYVEIDEEKCKQVDLSKKKNENRTSFGAAAGNKNEIKNINQRLDSISQTMNRLWTQMQQFLHHKQRCTAFESDIDIDIDEKKVSNDSVSPKQQQVKTWLNEIELDQYFNCFIENGFDDLEYIKCITMETLSRKEMKEIKLGHKFKIAKNVEKLMVS